jgi:hypothetical protein
MYQEQIFLLRLAHRFRTGPLSTLPQEILDLIIEKVLRGPERAKLKGEWHLQHICFQDRCTPETHFKPGTMFTDSAWKAWCQGDLNCQPFKCSPEDRAKMVLKRLKKDPKMRDWYWGDWHLDWHDDYQWKWLDLTCACKTHGFGGPGNFTRLNTASRCSLYETLTICIYIPL